MSAKSTTAETAVSRYLGWIFFQGFVLAGAVVGQLTVEDFLYAPWPIRVLDVVLAAWLLFALGRNLVRLWIAPPTEDRRSSACWLAVVGALFLLVSTGPLVESERWSTKPLGVLALLVGLNLVALAIRQFIRLRRRSIPAPTA